MRFEKRFFETNVPIWYGTYENLHNLVHWHHEAEMIYVLRGQASVGIGASHFAVREGDFCLCPGGTLHYTHSEGDSLIRIVIFDESLVGAMRDKLPSVQPVICPFFEDFYQALCAEMTEQKPFFEEKSGALLASFLTDVYRVSAPVGASHHPDSMRYRALLSYIDGHYQDITFSEAAQYMGFSPAYFSKMFRTMAGMTFTQYLNQVRVSRAVHLLRTSSSSVTRVAMECGFSTIRHFNRVFRQVTGTVPRCCPDTVLPLTPTAGERFDPTGPLSKLLEE